MCGILGFLDPATDPRERLRKIRQMGAYQAHRGPDAWGEWGDDAITLGHNRLAIIDIAGGVQPMPAFGDRHWIVFNGEIYNFPSLRRELAAQGAVFRTDHSDTEVIVEGYRLHGPAIFSRLDGMFGLALWDAAKRELVLARDRMGIKPLYFAQPRPRTVVFSSEPKALLVVLPQRPGLDAAGLANYFLYRAPLHPDSLFAGIQKVPPGGVITFSLANDRRSDDEIAHAACVPVMHRQEAIDRLEAVLKNACLSHLIADVPVGLFLSGGVDSSLVAALASTAQRLTAFTVATDSVVDERAHARAVADHLGLDLRVRVVSARDLLDQFDAWSYFNDDPVADPSALALMILSETARAEGQRVMLSGEGADELFGGYPAYLRYLLAAKLRRLPGPLRRGLSRWGGYRLEDYAAQHAIHYLGTAHVSSSAVRRALIPDLQTTAVPTRSGYPGPASRLREALLLDQTYRLANDVLMRTDRATMSASLEARVPLLDNHVVAAANRLPDAQVCRLWGLKTKPLLKQIAARHVPPRVVYRAKVGFDLPIDRWLAADFRERIEERLSRRHVAALDYAVLRRSYDALLAGRKGQSPLLWAWLTFEQWHQRWVEAAPAPLVSTMSRLPEPDRNRLLSV